MNYQYKQIAKCKIANRNYEVVLVNNEYYQVKLNRNKISNHYNENAAIKRMLAEANYDKTSLFEDKTENFPEDNVVPGHSYIGLIKRDIEEKFYCHYLLRAISKNRYEELKEKTNTKELYIWKSFENKLYYDKGK